MLEKFETQFSIVISVIVLAVLMAMIVARSANSEPRPELFSEPAAKTTTI